MNVRLDRWALIAVLIAIPLATTAFEQTFYLGFATRVLIFALAATALNLALGFAGMVSFGHAAFLGVGAYVVAILADLGVRNLWLAGPIAIAVCALLAAAIGAICLRTRGVYFIMITLAFAQMLYYIAVSLKAYGGDDGFALPGRSTGAPVSLGNGVMFYAVVAAVLLATLIALGRLLDARFGHAIRGIRENETRMEALGHPVYRLKLTCFVISGALTGLAGVLLANQNVYVSPALMHWQLSGLLLVMVIVGGTGHLYGGLIGALVILSLEEFLSGYTIYWKLGLGAAVIAVVLFAPQGVAGWIERARARRQPAGARPAQKGAPAGVVRGVER